MGVVEQRYEERRTFIEGQGHLVEVVPAGSALKAGQAVIAAPPLEPAARVVVTVADVSLDLACQVCEAAGMVVVPINFLSPEQLAELKIDPSTIAKAPVQEQPQAPGLSTKGLDAAAAIERVKVAATFDELNALMAAETRKTVIAAAEIRAEELKAEGQQ